MIGRTIGPYGIVAKLGEGGMGEVYRARDTTLDRDVALKILPASFASDPDRLMRFEREARTLASLNHPNIAAIYGIQSADGVRALVMELVEGEDLAVRIARGAIPLDEALAIAKQIADALEAAHERGIIHRDLKPANVKVRDDGTVKVLDFGLAKALEPDSAPGASAGQAPSQAPTITSPAMTQMGMILGTAGYMAPEQARGKAADRRADIWAFGCVLYEMLTGRRAFEGEDVSLTLSAVLQREADWAALPADLPPHLRQLLVLCLKKDVRRRIGDIRDVRLAMEGAFESPRAAAGGESTVRARVAGWKPALPWTVAALAAGSLITAIAVRDLRPAATEPPVERFAITTPADAPVVGFFQPNIAISPDGLRLVYRSEPGGYTTAGGRLYVRALGDLEPRRLKGADGAQGPFFSPDGEWVAFEDVPAGALKKVPVSGGPPQTICPLDGLLRGGTWGPDGRIVFATSSEQKHGLMRVSASGGTLPEPLTTVATARGEQAHLWPNMLPDGQSVLFAIQSKSGSRLAVVSMETGDIERLSPGTAPQFAAGYVVYADGDTLRATKFDPVRHELTGNSIKVASSVTSDPTSGAAQFSLARDGTLVYVSGSDTGEASRFVWVNQHGAEQSTPVPPGIYTDYRLSPDGRRVAVMSAAPDGLWVYDLTRGTRLRLAHSAYSPVWSHDGRFIVFSTGPGSDAGLYRVPADGSGAVEPVVSGRSGVYPTSTTSYGDVLFSGAGGTGIWEVPLHGDHAPTPVLKAPADANYGDVSPDGRWLAYQSKTSGEPEVYLTRIPGPGPVIPVSVGGGRNPRWSADGSALFYRSGNGMVTASVLRDGASVRVGPPKPILQGDYLGSVIGSAGYDVAPDGRFLMLKGIGSTAAQGDTSAHTMVMVRNWIQGLKQAAPSD